jgi:hypothetical protein
MSDIRSLDLAATDKAIHVNASPPIILVTKSDATVYNPPLVGLRLGDAAAAAITVVSNGVSVLISGIQPGDTVPGSFEKVMSTGTTAVLINGWQR